MSSSRESPERKLEDVEKAGYETSVHSTGQFTEIDLDNYYEDKAGSLVVDPAYVSSLLLALRLS